MIAPRQSLPSFPCPPNAPQRIRRPRGPLSRRTPRVHPDHPDHLDHPDHPDHLAPRPWLAGRRPGRPCDTPSPCQRLVRSNLTRRPSRLSIDSAPRWSVADWWDRPCSFSRCRARSTKSRRRRCTSSDRSSPPSSTPRPTSASPDTLRIAAHSSGLPRDSRRSRTSELPPPAAAEAVRRQLTLRSFPVPAQLSIALTT